MIAEIGLLIGGYVMLRCLSFLLRSGDRQEPALVRICAAIGGVLAAGICFDLLIRGLTTKMPGIP